MDDMDGRWDGLMEGVKGVIVWAGELVYNLSDQISFTRTGVGEGSLLILPQHRGGGSLSPLALVLRRD